MQILVLEASTSSVKAMVYDAGEGVLELVSAPYERAYSDGVSQDAERVYMALMELGQSVCAGKNISVISVVGVWHNLLILDKDSRPKSRAYAWNDTSAAPEIARLWENEARAKELYARTGCVPHSTYPAYRMLHQKKQKGFLEADSVIASQSSYIFSRLTGELMESVSTASGSGFLNIHRLEWDEEVLELAGIGMENLPPLANHSDARGLRREAAALLGVREGTPVIPAHPDGAMNQVGAGALQPGIMTISIGTSGALRLAADEPAIPSEPAVWCYYAPEHWLIGAAISGCTNCLDWLKDKILCNVFSLKQLDGMIEDLEAKTPVFLPFIAGERCPGWRDGRAGNLSGIHRSDTLGDLYLAILKGIACNIRQCYESLCAQTEVPRQIRVSGGIVKSAKWLNVLAGVLGKEIWISKEEQASMLGGCALGMLQLGAIRTLEEFAPGEHMMIEASEKQIQFFAAEYQRYLFDYAVK